MAATARKNLWWLGPIALVLLLGIALPALAGRGSVTVSAAVDNSDNTYTLTVSSTSGITSGDHFGLTLSTGAGALYSVGTIDLLNSQITVIDNLYSYAESAPFGVPNSLPAAAWYGTPTTKGHPQVPWNAKGWDAFDRYSKALLDDQVVSSIPIPLTDGGTGASSASAARTSLGLDTMATQGAGAVAITGGTITGITDLAVADGGTGASSASAARTALGLAIGTNVQAYHAYLADLAGVTAAQGNILYFNGTNWVVLAPGTSGYVLQTLGAGANPQWASGATTITVTEVDGSPSIAASTLKFTNGTVTDSGGGVATVTNSGGGGSPHDLLDGSTHQDTTAGTVTRGDLVTGQGGTPTWTRLALGADNSVLSSDGTDVGYETLTSLLDSAFGSTQGSVLYRNGSAWVVLTPGTTGQFLQTQGSAADPQWATVSAGSGDTAFIGTALLCVEQATAPSTPSAGTSVAYVDSNNNLRVLRDDGEDRALCGTDVRPVIHIQDQKSDGTGGGTPTGGTWNTRDLNTKVTDSGNHCTLSGNQIFLDEGTWEVHARAPAFGVNTHRLRFRNVTDSTTVAVGLALNTGSGTDTQIAVCEARFTIATNKTFELQHYIQTGTASGFGVTSPDTDEVEVYAEVWLTKVD